MKVDREAIARALVNLVNNALKYSDSEKFLGVKLYRDQACSSSKLSDRGIGIERNEQARIFEKFYRTCDPLVHNTKGSGLGLSLVRHITHAHGGEVEVESTPGQRQQIHALSLPVDMQSARRPQQEPDMNGIGSTRLQRANDCSRRLAAPEPKDQSHEKQNSDR